MAMPHPDRREELSREQNLLCKAETDIEQGWGRLRDQQDMVSYLQSSGRDTREAERLVQLMKCTLVEWERHRGLIEQRVAYLENEVSLAPRSVRAREPASILPNSTPISNI